MVIVALLTKKALKQTVRWLEAKSESLHAVIVTTTSCCGFEVDQNLGKQGLFVISQCQNYVAVPEVEEWLLNTTDYWEPGTEQGKWEVINPVLWSQALEDNCTLGDNECFRQYTVVPAEYSAYNHMIYFALRALLAALQNIEPELLMEARSRTDWVEPLNSNFSDKLVAGYKVESHRFSSVLHFSEEDEHRTLPYAVIRVFSGNVSETWNELLNSTSQLPLMTKLVIEFISWQNRYAKNLVD